MTTLLLLLGCASEPASDFVAAPSTDSAAEYAIYGLNPGYTAENVDAALDAGLAWSEIEADGLVTIRDEGTLDIVVQDLSDDPATAKSGGTAASGSATVLPGDILDLRIGALSGATYIFDVYGTNARTGSAIGDGQAREDVYRYTGSWEWRASSTSSRGWMSASLVCGSSCTNVRLKVANNASSASHSYGYTIGVY